MRIVRAPKTSKPIFPYVGLSQKKKRNTAHLRARPSNPNEKKFGIRCTKGLQKISCGNRGAHGVSSDSGEEGSKHSKWGKEPFPKVRGRKKMSGGPTEGGTGVVGPETSESRAATAEASAKRSCPKRHKNNTEGIRVGKKQRAKRCPGSGVQA